ncbi:hypothetical protein R3P38DRAFT_3502098 [Favolaschia claudopus]|uniref:Uncharacterized protein n=1 Tax=Favolaschia claudopus TaxID=2862362 RepID=A0AAV9Z343_9AGAR
MPPQRRRLAHAHPPPACFDSRACGHSVVRAAHSRDYATTVVTRMGMVVARRRTEKGGESRVGIDGAFFVSANREVLLVPFVLISRAIVSYNGQVCIYFTIGRPRQCSPPPAWTLTSKIEVKRQLAAAVSRIPPPPPLSASALVLAGGVRLAAAAELKVAESEVVRQTEGLGRMAGGGAGERAWISFHDDPRGGAGIRLSKLVKLPPASVSIPPLVFGTTQVRLVEEALYRLRICDLATLGLDGVHVYRLVGVSSCRLRSA